MRKKTFWNRIGKGAMMVFAAASVAASTVNALAEETTGEKVGQEVTDAGNTTKRGYRKAKKKVRDATGNSSAKKDMKDNLDNAKDDLGAAGDKIKDKVD